MKCPKCGANMPDNYNFCTSCRTDLRPFKTSAAKTAKSNEVEKLQESDTSTSDIEMVRNNAIWKMAPGEVARRISEKEIEQMSDLKGLVIQPGVTALVYCNGEEVAALESGNYMFVNESEVTRKISDKVVSHTEKSRPKGLLGRFKQGIINLLTSKKRRDKTRETQKVSIRKDIVQEMTNDSVFSVYLKQDRDFVITFGQTGPDGAPEFMPIRTARLDAGVGIVASVRIADFRQFVTGYLTGQNLVTTALLTRKLMPWVKNIVGMAFRNYTPDEMGVSLDVRQQIEDALVILTPEIEGLEFKRVIDLTCMNNGLERIRQIAEEQYLAEKEIESLIRSNEFENRLAGVANSKILQDAANDRDLKYALDEINKDKVLHEDELEQYYTLLSRQKRLRNAKDEADENKALNEIKATGLLSEDQLEAVKHSLALKEIERTSLLDLARLRTKSDVEMQRIAYQHQIEEIERQHLNKLALEESDHDIAMLNRDIIRQNTVDAYSDSRDEIALQKLRREEELKRQLERDAADDKFEDLKRKQAMSLDALERLKQMEAAESEHAHHHDMEIRNLAHQQEMVKEANRHTETMREKDIEEHRIDVQSTMSAEQILASRLDSSSEAATKLAESFGQKDRLEAERIAREKVEALHREMLESQKQQMAEQMRQQQLMMDKMMDFAKEGMRTTADIAAGHVSEARAQHDELKSQIKHEQQRVDETQKQSLDYITRQNAAEYSHQQPAATTICPHCGNQVAKERWCSVCGNEL